MSSDLHGRLQEALGDAYRIERELTRGGMSRLFLATEASLNRQVVVKVLPPDITSQVSSDRFRQEIELAAHLQHPNILPVLAAGTRGGLLYYVIPYVPGESLRHRLTREGRLPVADAIRILHEVADALAYAHAEGVIHRDIKPENILLEGSHAVLTDFGVAHALGESRSGGRITDTGLTVGTPGYMAPEQAAGERQVDGRADVYSMAVVGYEMLAGSPPFEGPSAQALLAAHLTATPRPLLDLRPEAPPAVAGAIARALAKDPNARLRTAAEFRDAVAPAQVEMRVRRISRRIMVGSGALLVLLLAGAALLVRRGPPGTLDGNLLAVAPFDVLDPKLELWREGLVDLLARNLDGAGALRTVPPNTVIRRWHGRADQLAAGELGRRTGARLVVFGSLVPTGGDSVRIRASLFDAGSERPLADLEVRDATTRIDRLTDSLTVRLLAELGRNRRIELTRVASLGSTSLPALKAFLQGEQWFRRAAWDSALAAYERAVALDSAFCLALWRLARVVGWQRAGGDSLVTALSIRAGALTGGLAPRDSLLVTVDSILSADLPFNWDWYTRLSRPALEAVRRYPDDADAWFTLGEVYDHAGMAFGVSVEEALATFDRAIALDSAYAPAYLHAIELASWARGLEAAQVYARHYLRRAPGDVTAEAIRLALDLADPLKAHTPDAQRRLQQASGSVLLKAWLAFYGATDSGEVAVRIGRELGGRDSTEAWLNPRFRRAARVSSLTYRGHLREAAAKWTPHMGAAALFLTQISLLSSHLADTAAAYFTGTLKEGRLNDAEYGLPWWAARRDLGSIARFERLADSIARFDRDPARKRQGTFTVAAARAYHALARADTSEALKRFESLPESLCVDCYQERLTRLLLQSARRQDRKVVDAKGPWSFFPTAQEVIGRLEQARAADRLNERERAIRGYRFVADAWQHADPELQPYVAEARHALARLGSESGT